MFSHYHNKWKVTDMIIFIVIFNTHLADKEFDSTIPSNISNNSFPLLGLG